jgi:DUF4097 and DUF4098 domain-containing protein YvlB
MRKIKWIFIIMIVLGLAGGVGALAMYEFDFDAIYADISHEKYFTAVTETVDVGTINSIYISAHNEDIIIKSTASTEFKLSYYKHKYYSKVEYSSDNDTLHFEMKEKWAFRLLYFPKEKYSQVVLEVPTSFAGSAKIVLYNGDISSSDVGYTDFEITSYNGDIYIGESDCGHLDVTSYNGDVHAHNVSVNSMRAESYNGNNYVDIVGSKADYNIRMSSDNGKSYLDGGSFSGFLNNSRPDNLIELKTHNGNNHLTF